MQNSSMHLPKYSLEVASHYFINPIILRLNKNTCTMVYTIFIFNPKKIQ